MNQWRVEVTVSRNTVLAIPFMVEARTKGEAEAAARALARLQVEREHPETIDMHEHKHPDRFQILEANADACS